MTGPPAAVSVSFSMGESPLAPMKPACTVSTEPTLAVPPATTEPPPRLMLTPPTMDFGPTVTPYCSPKASNPSRLRLLLRSTKPTTR